MNDHLLTEQEQIQQLKTWLKRYGPTVLIGIVIALVISFSWRAWQQHRNKVLLHASSVYDEMLTARAENNPNEAILQAKKLLNHYSNTPYADIAAFILARDAIVKKNYSEAISQLTWVMNHAKNHSIRQIARLREARVLISQKNPQEAINLLKKINDKTFMGLIDEIRGDAYLAMNDKISARQSYEKAVKELPNSEIIRPILQMKFENLSIKQSHNETI